MLLHPPVIRLIGDVVLFRFAESREQLTAPAGTSQAFKLPCGDFLIEIKFTVMNRSCKYFPQFPAAL